MRHSMGKAPPTITRQRDTNSRKLSTYVLYAGVVHPVYHSTMARITTTQSQRTRPQVPPTTQARPGTSRHVPAIFRASQIHECPHHSTPYKTVQNRTHFRESMRKLAKCVRRTGLRYTGDRHTGHMADKSGHPADKYRTLTGHFYPNVSAQNQPLQA